MLTFVGKFHGSRRLSTTLDLSKTSVTGDMRKIGEHDFPTLELLILPSSVYGGVGHQLQLVSEAYDPSKNNTHLYLYFLDGMHFSQKVLQTRTESGKFRGMIFLTCPISSFLSKRDPVSVTDGSLLLLVTIVTVWEGLFDVMTAVHAK